ncbi:MAG: DUF3592 domain-containing protein [Ruminococcus sp.]|nr:DUF3592 domain-containing protein [Ruminococcus sp.]
MKVDKLDLAWSAISMVIVGYSYRHGALLKGLILIYILMAAVFLWHIYVIRRRMRGSIAVYGTITDYHGSKKNSSRFKGWYPVVKYTTETGREITSVYTVEDSQQRYEIGSEELICYDPEDPMFFYFSSKKDDLYKDYYRLLVFGGAIAAMLLAYILIK